MQQMEIFRRSVTIFSLCLFHSTLTETQSMCKGNLPLVKHVAVNGNATVSCPILSAPEMDFKLFKGSVMVTSRHINTQSPPVNPEGNVPAHFSVNLTDNSTSFILLSVTMNTTALYTCEAVIIYPPPFVKVDEMPQTIVFVKESPRKQHPLCQHANHLVLWVVLGGMTTYGLVMTCIVLMLRIKLSQMDTPCYGIKNMKFKECRRRWQGVQHPTRQGFYIDTVA
ncbi:T-cell-specific surface glycoprotein CD28 homolog [Myxocyprinus asiaticus]|uniref:T-cell-specific surface glycoprotein CD28 homolog n=1 Tax=Myxocyprinus asiaticus TaxID=70543 RepID=UPI00222391ED|nr:T-cell-specific surface glycoprotein CD28 homolog [Myxocyprinus asiaticus]